MKKLFITCFITLLWVVSLQAQQRPHYSQYFLNYYLVNPAVVGSTDDTQIKASYRKQWTGIADAPSTFYATYNSHISKELGMRRGQHKNHNTSHHGYGFQVMADKAGPLSVISAYGTYAYHFPISKETNVSFGASLGAQQFSLDVSNLDIANSSSNQPGNISEIKPDGNLGLWIYSKKFFGGVSMNQVFNNKIERLSASSGVNKLHVHYFATAGYKFGLGEHFDLAPSILFKAVYPVPPSVDINTKLIYKKMAWTGVSYRHKDAYCFVLGGLIAHKFELSYAYDLGFSALSAYSRGSHEVLVGLRLNSDSKIWSPSDFW